MNDAELLALALVLVAAVMHATWNAIVKGDTDRTSSMAVALLVGVVVGAVILSVRGLPARESWPWLAGSLATHGIYFLGLIRAYRHGDLGHVYPIARGSAPLFIALASATGLLTMLTSSQDDAMTTRELAGALLISLGIASLTFFSGATKVHAADAHARDAHAQAGADTAQRAVAEARATRHRALRWALLTGVAIATYSICDGNGARRSGDPIAYAAMSCALQIFWIVVLMSIAGRARVIEYVRRSWYRALIGGGVSAAAWIIVLWAMTILPIAHVAALRETSVIFAAVIGAKLLHEKLGARRVVAATIVAIGMILMRLGA